jgi:hypothetical protein
MYRYPARTKNLLVLKMLHPPTQCMAVGHRQTSQLARGSKRLAYTVQWPARDHNEP